MRKVCSRCKESKPVEAFSKNRTTADGLTVWCKPCYVEYRKEYKTKNKENLKAYNKKRYMKDKEKYEAYRTKNKEKIKEYFKAHYAKNKERLKKQRANYAKEYREKNKDKRCHWASMCRAARIQRTPCWLTEDDKVLIKRKYELAKKKTESTGERWVVDHILPLQGTLVSGLHVPANLRVIKEITNLRKHNKYTPV